MNDETYERIRLHLRDHANPRLGIRLAMVIERDRADDDVRFEPDAIYVSPRDGWTLRTMEDARQLLCVPAQAPVADLVEFTLPVHARENERFSRYVLLPPKGTELVVTVGDYSTYGRVVTAERVSDTELRITYAVRADTELAKHVIASSVVDSMFAKPGLFNHTPSPATHVRSVRRPS